MSQAGRELLCELTTHHISVDGFVWKMPEPTAIFNGCHHAKLMISSFVIDGGVVVREGIIVSTNGVPIKVRHNVPCSFCETPLIGVLVTDE